MKLLILLGLILPAMSREINSHVVGGSDTDIANHPHQLSLRLAGSHSCGASLIGTTKAVTAAHCVGSAASLYTILGGTTSRTDTTCETCKLFKPSQLIANPDFVQIGIKGFPNDVAVLIFEEQAYNMNFINIVMATSADGDFAGNSCVITGWGKTAAISALPVVLQQASMTAMTNEACAAKWSAAQINDGHICVNGDPTSSACNGDSGGPLVCKGKLVGATSWGNSSCSPAYPSVYTRISYFVDWINAQK